MTRKIKSLVFWGTIFGGPLLLILPLALITKAPVYEPIFVYLIFEGLLMLFVAWMRRKRNIEKGGEA